MKLINVKYVNKNLQAYKKNTVFKTFKKLNHVKRHGTVQTVQFELLVQTYGGPSLVSLV